MSKYTPGPWRTGCLDSYNGTTGEPEAFVYRLPPDDPEETAHNRICVRGSAKMDCRADAEVIAAAPEALDLLLAAYHAGHREGWEPGANVRQVSSAIHGFLCNLGLDPNKRAGRKRWAEVSARLERLR